MILIRITMKIRIHFQCYHRLLLPRLPRRTETRGSTSPFLRPSLPYSLGYSVADSHDGVNSLFQMYSTARNFGTLLWKKYWFIHYLWEPSMCWAPTMKIARFTHHLLIGTLTPIAIFCTKFVSIILLPVAIARIFFVDRVYVEIHFELTKRTDW